MVYILIDRFITDGLALNAFECIGKLEWICQRPDRGRKIIHKLVKFLSVGNSVVLHNNQIASYRILHPAHGCPFSNYEEV